MTIDWRRRVAPPLFFVSALASLMLAGCGAHRDDAAARASEAGASERSNGTMPDKQTLQQAFGNDFAAAAAADPNGPPVPVTPGGAGQVNAQAEPIPLDRH